MLLNVTIKNYKSIGDKIILDMIAGSGNDHTNFLFIKKNNVKILPIVAIYGKNASGKTNVLEAIYNICRNITELSKYEDEIKTTPFLYDSELSGSPSEFEISIAIKPKENNEYREYKYGYKATKDMILKEWLYERKLSKNETKWQIIFERNESEIKFHDKYKKLKDNSGIINNKMLLLSFFGDKQIENIQIFSEIYKWFGSLVFISNKQNLQENINRCARIYYDNDKIRKKFMEFMIDFDSSLEDIFVEKGIGSTGKDEYRVFTKHNCERYPFDIESDGTKKLFVYCVLLFKHIEEQRGVFIADELDSQLHSLVMQRIVMMYHDEKQNKQESQLIFSSHNLITMDNDLLRRDEIWITEKTEKFTELRNLSKIKINDQEVRADLNYSKNYLLGRFENKK